MNNFLIVPLAAIAVFGLVWWYRRSRVDDALNDLMTQHPDASIRTRAHLINGGNHFAVALTLEPQQITYQNADIDGSIVISEIDEVEYGSDLVTGGIADGA